MIIPINPDKKYSKLKTLDGRKHLTNIEELSYQYNKKLYESEVARLRLEVARYDFNHYIGDENKIMTEDDYRTVVNFLKRIDA